MIPFVDLKQQYSKIQKEIDTAIFEVIHTAAFVGGPQITEFETSFAKYLGVSHCISCANGTDSIEILLKALEISEGDEVIVPAISWIATSEAVSSVGAIPVFVDVNEDYYTIEISQIEKVITSKTKAIIPVHLYGQAVDMKSIMNIAEKYSLYVIEDCAQAHGAEYNGQKVGTFGHCASFSFFPGKNLGAYGDAGCMVTNSDTIAEKARMIANHGQKGRHNHLIEGRNSRMDSIQAAVLQVKLPYLDSWNSQRINAAALYSQLLQNTTITIPKVVSNSKHVFHLFVIQSENRDILLKKLHEKHIMAAIHYPKALPFLPCYAARNFSESDFPVAARIQNRILSLPIFPEISNVQIEEICSIIKTHI